MHHDRRGYESGQDSDDLKAPDHDTALLVPQFNCPVEVNWSFMDGSLLRRFWAAHADERAAAAPINDRILVFVRGITTVRCARWCHDPGPEAHIGLAWSSLAEPCHLAHESGSKQADAEQHCRFAGTLPGVCCLLPGIARLNRRTGTAMLLGAEQVFISPAVQVRARGTYINDKIDLLVQYLLIDPFQAVYSRITKRKARSCHAAPNGRLSSWAATPAKGCALGLVS